MFFCLKLVQITKWLLGLKHCKILGHWRRPTRLFWFNFGHSRHWSEGIRKPDRQEHLAVGFIPLSKIPPDFRIREAVESLMAKNYPSEKRRPMILPIEWRSSLVLDGDLTVNFNSVFKQLISLSRTQLLCHECSASEAPWILLQWTLCKFFRTSPIIIIYSRYYQSPLYRQEIISGVIKCLNSTYSKFIQSHPNFNGPVSIFAHSLGSVIAYDILTNWSPVSFSKFFLFQPNVLASSLRWVHHKRDWKTSRLNNRRWDKTNVRKLSWKP